MKNKGQVLFLFVIFLPVILLVFYYVGHLAHINYHYSRVKNVAILYNKSSLREEKDLKEYFLLNNLDLKIDNYELNDGVITYKVSMTIDGLFYGKQKIVYESKKDEFKYEELITGDKILSFIGKGTFVINDDEYLFKEKLKFIKVGRDINLTIDNKEVKLDLDEVHLKCDIKPVV